MHLSEALHDPKVEMGTGAKLEPFAMAKAGTMLAAGASIAPQSAEAASVAAAKKRGAKPAPVLGALGTQLHSRALSPAQTAYLQVTTRSLSSSQSHFHVQTMHGWRGACRWLLLCWLAANTTLYSTH